MIEGTEVKALGRRVASCHRGYWDLRGVKTVIALLHQVLGLYAYINYHVRFV